MASFDMVTLRIVLGVITLGECDRPRILCTIIGRSDRILILEHWVADESTEETEIESGTLLKRSITINRTSPFHSIHCSACGWVDVDTIPMNTDPNSTLNIDQLRASLCLQPSWSTTICSLGKSIVRFSPSYKNEEARFITWARCPSSSENRAGSTLKILVLTLAHMLSISPLNLLHPPFLMLFHVILGKKDKHWWFLTNEPNWPTVMSQTSSSLLDCWLINCVA